MHTLLDLDYLLASSSISAKLGASRGRMPLATSTSVLVLRDGWWLEGEETNERGRERKTQEAEAHLTPCGVSLTLGSSATNWISSLTRVWSLSNRWEPEHPSCIKHPRHPVHPHPHRARSGPPLAAFLFRYVPLSLIRRSLPSFEYALPFSFSSFPFLFFPLFSLPAPFLPSFLFNRLRRFSKRYLDRDLSFPSRSLLACPFSLFHLHFFPCLVSEFS